MTPADLTVPEVAFDTPADMRPPSERIGEQIAVLSITRHGVATAGRIVAALPEAQLFAPEKFRREALEQQRSACVYEGRTADVIGELFAAGYGAMVAVLSLGALVRMIAPHLKDKTRDPAIIALDEGGRFAIPVLSGHLGGANSLAVRLAKALDAQAVLTTASDSRATLAVDLLGRELGWTLDASHEALVHAAAAVVNDEPVAIVQEAGEADWWTRHADGRTGPLPANLVRVASPREIDPARFAALLWISQRPLPASLAQAFGGRCVAYRLPGDGSDTTRPSGDAS